MRLIANLAFAATVFIISPIPALSQRISGIAPTTQVQASNRDDRTSQTVKKMVEAFGGEERLGRLKATKSRARGEQIRGGVREPIDMTTLFVFPDHMHTVRETVAADGSRTVTRTALTPATGWTQTNDQPATDLSQRVRSVGLQRMHTGTMSVPKHATDGLYSFTTQGTERIGGVDAIVLEIRGPANAKTRWYVDPDTGRPLRAVEPSPVSDGNVVSDYLEWNVLDGILLPRRMRFRFPDGAEATIEYVQELNPAIDMKVFEKPVSTTKPAPDPAKP